MSPSLSSEMNSTPRGAQEIHHPAVARQHVAPRVLRPEQRPGLVGHVFPEAEHVHVGVGQDLIHHLDHEIRVRLHHLFHERGVIVEERAEPLHADQIAQRPEESAPTVGDDDEREVARAVGGQPLLPVGAQACSQVRLHPFPPEAPKVLARLDGKTHELGHRRHAVVLPLPHQDALVIDVEHRPLVLFDHLAIEGRVGVEPAAVPFPTVDAKRQPLGVVALARPSLDGLRPGAELPVRRPVPGLIAHRSQKTLSVCHDLGSTHDDSLLVLLMEISVEA